jgi:outer membrane receptor protein involved in Fe transport
MVVTATRDPREVFTTPVPVTVVDSATLARQPANNAADALYEEPGLDANGVGPSQPRPVIRGQFGQRILLLENGLRLNNSRRQSDFGELPALVPVEDIARIEVVRGPASVLYGSDAVGGVVNLITTQPLAAGGGPRVHGAAGIRYSGSGEFARPWASTTGQSGSFSFHMFGAWRDAGSYTAPSGRFGQVSAPSDLRVHGTGVSDENLAFELGYRVNDRSSASLRYERYAADDAGFGYLDSAAFNRPDLPFIRISYPRQQVDRFTADYGVRGLHLPVADRVSVAAWYQSNDRALNFDIFAPFGPGTPPGAGADVHTRNHTDVNSWGFRVEAARAFGGRTLLTYGVDGYHDRSLNDDSSSTTIVGFGPPQTFTSTTPQLPYATYRSLGAFAQLTLTPIDRLTVIGGGRVQDTRARTQTTPGLTLTPTTSKDATVVGALNASYLLTRRLSMVGSVSSGFRSPNLIERFFEGPTPEGQGFQHRSPNLDPETSVSLDAGLRWRSRRVDAEAFVFRNTVHDGIGIVPTGDSVQGLPAFTNTNIARLRYQGIELAATVRVWHGVSLGGNYSHIDANDRRDPSNPIAGSYSDKVVGTVRYERPGGRFWAAYLVRYNGEQKNVNLLFSPVGTVWPSFTVQAVRAGATLFRTAGTRHAVAVAVENLGNAFYSEPTNASLFRPAAGRNVQVSYRMDF